MNENEVKEVTPDPVEVDEVFDTVDRDDPHKIIEFFKEQGFDVTIRHHRHKEQAITLEGLQRVPTRNGGATTFEASRTFGKTKPHIVTKAYKELSQVGFMGVAHCNKCDVYSKKVGVALAANRALDAYLKFMND